MGPRPFSESDRSSNLGDEKDSSEFFKIVRAIRPERRDEHSRFAKDHQLGSYVRWGEGEEKDEKCKNAPTTLDAITEAIIGAIFLDAQRQKKNGMNVVKKILKKKKIF